MTIKKIIFLVSMTICTTTSAETLWNNIYKDGEYMKGFGVHESNVFFKLSSHNQSVKASFHTLNEHGQDALIIDDASSIEKIGPVNSQGILFLAYSDEQGDEAIKGINPLTG